MDVYKLLSEILLFFSVILHVTQLCRSHFINIEVSGRYLVQTGISTYTASTYRKSNVIIKCLSRVSVSSELSLFKDNEPIDDYDTLTHGISFEKRADQVGGKYSCALKISTWFSNDSYSDFTVWNEVEILTKPDTVLCASSVGRLGYVGEDAILQCMSVSNNYRCSFEGQYSSHVVQQKVLEEPLSEKSCNCDRQFWQGRSCRLHSISFVESVIMKIFTTVNSTQPDTSMAGYVCTSNPPRLMYWTVFGTHGILFDFNNLNSTLFKVNTTINITQSPGQTSLVILEAVSGGNGIHSVLCSTYDTRARVVALYRTHYQSGKKSGCNLSSVKPTDNNPITTVEGTTLVITTTEAVQSSQDSEMNPTEQGYEMKTDSSNDYFLMAVVGLPLLVTNLILVVVVVYMHNRMRNKLNIVVSAQSTSHEIELHDNPVYLPFTETKNSLANENEEMECTYANL